MHVHRARGRSRDPRRSAEGDRRRGRRGHHDRRDRPRPRGLALRPGRPRDRGVTEPAGSGRRFASRAGLKLEHGLDAFELDVTGFRCADFGANVGGFTDCLLQRGAIRVVAIDTGRGVLAWPLRQDPRVETRERTNALHDDPPEGGVDLVVIDLAWTPQRLAIPAALRWLDPAGARRILTLVKPHYELAPDEKGLLDRGFLPQEHAPRVLDSVLEAMPELGVEVLGATASPLVGGKTAKRRGVPGNIEYVALLTPSS
ncbi:MAG: TlyA family rRNA (cytidine-2'-O)-methyltransferase [Planctomycetaceae bacterium]|nr:TlyA family rRNA (cytidine-2'-O)-methyltransferase [Planctomycetaceae bacterium]